MTVAASREYRAALDYLFARTTGDTKLGLERTTGLLRLLGDPHRRFKSFHVAGTNGKGSVVASVEALLRSRGFDVAAYTSPHLVDFRERIRLGGRHISEEEVVAFIERWTPDAERLGATFFEVTTALAFDWFARQGAEVAVIETGLGGRLDATNVITPLVACVTSVSLDHTDMLGETIVQIAMEKAGIFKRGVPAVVGERKSSVARELANLAAAMGAGPVVEAAKEYDTSDVRVGPGGTGFAIERGGRSFDVSTPLIGEHQAWNTATAIAMVRAAGAAYSVPLDECTEALRDVRLPGRLDRRGKFIFDVAHNPAGIAVLLSALARMGIERPLVAVLGVLSDKDWRGMVDLLAPAVDELILAVPPTAPANRRWDPTEAADYASSLGANAAAVSDLAAAVAQASDRGATVLVTGSFHTVGDAMSCLQLSPMAA
ncbi:MAG TPA: folylpolyglutamate synthase/dihydrofolate synthase family protein [Candidatus Limnocylindria bacterium]|nr:folylpolyglutamate synthase/dihydrofolate synthase family protein [Candidatus Limnocylindria bacterium]